MAAGRSSASLCRPVFHHEPLGRGPCHRRSRSRGSLLSRARGLRRPRRNPRSAGPSSPR